jgi:hypothetical protein
VFHLEVVSAELGYDVMVALGLDVDLDLHHTIMRRRPALGLFSTITAGPICRSARTL